MKNLSFLELLAAQSDEADIRVAAVMDVGNRMVCFKTLF